MRISRLITALSIIGIIAGPTVIPTAAQAQMVCGADPSGYCTYNGRPFVAGSRSNRASINGSGFVPRYSDRAGYYYPGAPQTSSNTQVFTRGKNGEAVEQASTMRMPNRPPPGHGGEWGCEKDPETGGYGNCDYYYTGKDRSLLIAASTFVAVVASAVVLQKATCKNRYYC